MSAYVIVHAIINDPEKMKGYGTPAGPSVKAAGDEVITSGVVAGVLAGSHGHQRTIILRFADAYVARRDWCASNAYQAAIPIREQAMDAVFILAENPLQ
jgi:uncharacterized protein (DUF1330 family)